MASETSKNTSMLSKLKGGISDLVGSSWRAELALRVTVAAIEKLGQTLSELNDISERLSVVNSTLQKEIMDNTGALEKNTVGFGLAMKALAELRVAGFDETNKNLINLITRTKISGQDTAAIISLGKAILATGGSINRSRTAEFSSFKPTTIAVTPKVATVPTLKSTTILVKPKVATVPTLKTTTILVKPKVATVPKFKPTTITVSPIVEKGNKSRDSMTKAISHQEGIMDRLSKNIVDLSLKYGTTTDSMVKAITQLSDNFELLSIMGGLETTTGVTAELTARLGQENSKLVGSLMKELTSTNADLNMQAILGVEKLGDLLAMGNISTEEAIQGIIKGSERAANLQRAASNTSRRVLAATFGGTNKFLIRLRLVGEKLADAQKPIIGIFDALKRTLTVIKETVFDPFKSVAVGLLKPFTMLIKGISLLVASILNLVLRVFSPAIAAVMEIVGVVAGAIGFVVMGIAGVVEKLYDVLSLVPGLGYLFADSDAEQNSSLNSIKKLLETMVGTDKDLLGIATSEARTNEKNRLDTITAAGLTGIHIEAALRDIDFRSRRMDNNKSTSIENALNKLADSTDKKVLVNAIREVTQAIFSTQESPYPTGI